MQALPQQHVAVAGCYSFGVISNEGEAVFSMKLNALEASSATGGAANFVAVEVDKLIPGKKVLDATPARIDVYDLATKANLISVPLTAENPYYDVSSRGELAVVDNDTLSVYFPKEQ